MSGMKLATDGPDVNEEPARGGFLNLIERVGNKVPHPVMMFFYLIIGVIVLSAVLSFANVSITQTIVVPNAVPAEPGYFEDTTQPSYAVPDPSTDTGYHEETVTVPVNSLLSADGIRFIFTSFVPNFAGFGVVAVTFIALMGAGVAEAS